MKKHLLIALTCAISAFGQGVHYYPYDDTDAVSYQLTSPRKDSELRMAHPGIVENFVCGRYKVEYDYTGGFILHVFPDKTFMIAEWADILLPTLVAEGRWSITDKGEVILDWKKSDFGSGLSESFFIEQYGKCRKLKLLLCFSNKCVDDVLLVSEDQIGANIKHAYWRSEVYLDWAKTQAYLKRKKE